MRIVGRGRALIVATMSCALLAATAAEAQKAPEVGKADALFNAGRSLLEAGEYGDACPKFAESQKLAPGLGVTLYLADCYERLGRTASALIEFKRAVEIASSRGDKRGAVAAERAARLESRVPLLSIVVTPAARAQGVTVTRDGELVPASQWDTPVRVNPGAHDIAASAPSKETSHTKVELVPSATTVTTTIDALEPPKEATAVVPPPVAEAPPPVVVPVPQTRKWAALVEGGAGIVGVGLGAVFGALAISKLNASNAGPCNGGDRCTGEGLSLRSQADTFGNASTIAFVVGGVAVASGAVLYLTAPKAGKSEGVVVAPLVSAGVFGLNARSSF
jgi:hypothetical protein